MYVGPERKLALDTQACRDRCCAPSGPRNGWTSLVRCVRNCPGDEVTPEILYIRETVAPGQFGCQPGAVIYFSGVCYRCTGLKLWDCVNDGPAPDGYDCVPFGFYIPGVRIESTGGGGQLLSCASPACVFCAPENYVTCLPLCDSCNDFTRTRARCFPDANPNDACLFRWGDVLDALRTVPGVLNRRCAAIRSGLCCFKIDLIASQIAPGPLDQIPPPATVRTIEALFETCCQCTPTVDDGVDQTCLSSWGRLRCEAGLRRDSWKSYLCVPETPVMQQCCCPNPETVQLLNADGSPGPTFDGRCVRQLKFVGRRVQTAGGSTVTVTAFGVIPGVVTIRTEDATGTTENRIDFNQSATCDPWGGLSLNGGPLPCNQTGGESQTRSVASDCRRASMVALTTRTDGFRDEFTYTGELGQWGSNPPDCPGCNCDAIDDSNRIPGEPPFFWRVCDQGCGGGEPLYIEPGEPPPGGRPAPSPGAADILAGLIGGAS